MLLKTQIEIYQWLVPLMAIIFCYRVFVQFRRNKRLLLGSILWIGFWLVTSFLAIFPDLISFSIAEMLGFKSHINAIIFVWLGFLFIMVYNQSSTISKLEKDMSELVRKVAIEKQKNKELTKSIKPKRNKDLTVEDKV